MTWTIGSFDDQVKMDFVGAEVVVMQVTDEIPINLLQSLAHTWNDVPFIDEFQNRLLVGVIRKVAVKGDALCGIVEAVTEKDREKFKGQFDV